MPKDGHIRRQMEKAGPLPFELHAQEIEHIAGGRMSSSCERLDAEGL